jgi:lambda family phage portal protein
MFGLFKKKETASARAEWLNKAIDTAASRAHQAMMSEMHAAKRGFESAETPAWTSSWETTSNEINIDLAQQLPTIRSRSRNLARNNEWAERYLIQLKDNVIGSNGIRLQMRLTKRNGEPEPTNDRIEKAWTVWGERGNCEVSGKLTWQQIEMLVLETLARDGEFLIRFRYGVGPFGFQIQILNPALLDVTHNGRNGNNRIRMGIEINDDGKPIAYYIRAGKSGEAAPSPYTVSGQHVRIPADEIIHGFEMREVDQLRGVPWLSIGARRLWLLQDFEQAAAVASSNAAKRQGFFVSPTGDAPAGFADTIVSSVLDAARAQGKVLTPEEIERIVSAAEKYTTTMPGQFDTLPQGYDFKSYESVWPNIDANSYVKQQVRGFAAARGVSYATLGNDLEAVNYSSARVGIIDEREHYKTLQTLLINALHHEVYKRWLPYAVLATPSLSAQRIDAYLDGATWQPRRWVGIDPIKEAKANEINLAMRLTSRRRIQLERGDDPDEIAQEIAAEEKLYGPIVPVVSVQEDDNEDKKES